MILPISQKWKLSDEHAASSYGQPVLVNSAGEAFGSGDIVQLFPTWPTMPAHMAVQRLLATIDAKRKPSEQAFIDKFLKGGLR